MSTSFRALAIASFSLSFSFLVLANDTPNQTEAVEIAADTVSEVNAEESKGNTTQSPGKLANQQLQPQPPATPLEKSAVGVDTHSPVEEETPADVQLPIDLKAAADIAIAAFGGEVLKAEQVEDEGGLHFVIRTVNNGRVRDVVIDAANGEIVRPIETDKVEGVNVEASASPVPGLANTTSNASDKVSNKESTQ